MTCPKNFTCLFTISLSSFLFVFALLRTSTVVTWSVYEILCILMENHISVAFSLLQIFKLSVHASDPYNNVDHIEHFRNLHLSWILIFLFFRTFSNDVNDDFAMAILCWTPCSHLPYDVNMLAR